MEFTEKDNATKGLPDTVTVRHQSCVHVAKTNFQDFSQQTTCHGVAHVADMSRGIVRRILWLLCLLACLGSVIWYIVMQVQLYRDKPVGTKIVYKLNDSLVFPSVTVCNLNMVKQSELAKQEAATAEFVRAIGGVNPELSPELLEHAKTVDMHALIRTTAPTLNDTFVMCAWSGSTVSCEDYLYPVMTRLGLCHTFNHKFRVMEHGHLIMRSIGSEKGLRLRMNVQQQEYSPLTASFGAGFKMLVHSPFKQPLVGEIGTLVSPGEETEMPITMSVEKRLGPPYTHCVDTFASDFVNPLQYFADYSRSTCGMDCYLSFLIAACGCLPYYADPEQATDTKYCTAFEYFTCIYPNIQEYSENVSHSASCGCQHSCYDQTYQTSVSSVKLPNSYISKSMQKRLNMTLGEMRENIVEVKVYYTDFSFQQIVEYEEYSLPSLAGDIGGMMGLCLGCSILTIIEFIEFVILMCRHNNKQTKPKD